MNNIRKLAILSCLIALAGVIISGCAPIPSREVDPKSLTAPTATAPLTLTKPYTWIAVQKGSSALRYVLSAGVYTPKLSGPQGTYYRGPTKCVAVVSGTELDSSAFLRDGGIFISSQGSQSPVIYLHKSSDMTTVKVSGAISAPVIHLDKSPDTTTAQTNSISDTAQALAVPPAGPKVTLVNGIGAGIGAAIVQAAILANEGKIMIPDNQPDDEALLSRIQF